MSQDDSDYKTSRKKPSPSTYTVASFVPRTVSICDEDSLTIIVLLNKYVLPRKVYLNLRKYIVQN